MSDGLTRMMLGVSSDCMCNLLKILLTLTQSVLVYNAWFNFDWICAVQVFNVTIVINIKK